MLKFDEFTLDPEKGELCRDGRAVELEPQVFSLLLQLVLSEGRIITRDELLQTVWRGRVVSDAAIASRIKILRKALGDDGAQQRILRTVPKRGFRFMPEVSRVEESGLPGHARTPIEDGQGAIITTERPSLAVLPFARWTEDEHTAIAANAIPNELIAELARLRWLFVTARGSASKFLSYSSDQQRVGLELGVRYCLSGAAATRGEFLTLSVELTNVEDGGIIWSDNFEGKHKQFSDLRSAIKSQVITALELEIPSQEAQRARLVDPERLSTWSHFHLGLQHLNCFTAKDIRQACDHFQRALDLEPTFARAHAALSAAHFQLAFQHLADDRQLSATLARKHAERSIDLDAQDPFANFVMGRVHWLERDVLSGEGWLQRATALSPSSAKSHYACGWSDAILGRFDAADARANLALKLSPLDPFRYGMLGVRALSSLGQGDYENAAKWSQESAAAPGAHALIALIAVASHELNGDSATAKRWAEVARRRQQSVLREHFFGAFPFTDESLRKVLDAVLVKHGF